MVIVIFAGMLKVSVEALVAVVLAHELAHAYTHVGHDIDGREWETRAFASTDLSVVEGLAQHYTAVVARRLQDRFPGMLIAYETLLERQVGPYRAHLDWLPQVRRRGEIVRLAMVGARSHSVRDYAAFLDELKSAQHVIHRPSLRGQSGTE